MLFYLSLSCNSLKIPALGVLNPMSEPNSANPIDIKSLGIYIVEGTVEVDPITEKVTIRTVKPSTDEPFSFDPIPALTMMKGKEVRFILTPMASVSILEELHKKAESEKPSTN